MNTADTHPDDSTIHERIALLEQRIAAMGGMVGCSAHVPPEIRLAFLQSVLDYETAFSNRAEWEIDLRAEIGNRLDPPEDDTVLADDEVADLIRAMAEILAQFHVQLEQTNHLTDRELYRKILGEVLEEPLLLGPNVVGGLWHHPCCSCTDDETWLKFYADDALRELWRDENDAPLPAREPFKADRDQWLEALAHEHIDRPLPELTVGRQKLLEM